MKPGGLLIGIIPDSEKIIMKTPLQDDMGNFFITKGSSYGGFGEKLFVNLIDTPYYKDGAKSEPIAHKDLLWGELEKSGFRLDYLLTALSNRGIREFKSAYYDFI